MYASDSGEQRDRRRFTSEPTRAGNSLGGLCAVTTAIVLMVFGLIAAAVAIRSSPFGPSLPTPVRAEPIDGAIALRPDLLSQARWPFPPSGAFTSTTADGSRAVAEGSPERPDAVSPLAGSVVAEVRLVREFYDQLGTDPARATELVSNRLLGVDRARVNRAWAAVDSVRVLKIDSTFGHTRVDALATYPDGATLRLRQLITIDTDVCPRIVDIDLLGARYSPP